MEVVDLSCDLGESYGNFKVGKDEEVIPFIASASCSLWLRITRARTNSFGV